MNINDRPSPEDDHGTEVQSWESLRDSLQMQRVATERAIDELRKAQRQRDAAVEALRVTLLWADGATARFLKEHLDDVNFRTITEARATLAAIKGDL